MLMLTQQFPIIRSFKVRMLTKEEPQDVRETEMPQFYIPLKISPSSTKALFYDQMSSP